MKFSKRAIQVKVFISINFMSLSSFAGTDSSSSNSSSNTDAEQVNVDSIKEKYWARGNETELGVVQNRTFSKTGKFEFSLLGGALYSDPFLDVKMLGGTLGYHINEYFSFHLMAFKDLVSPSAALLTFQNFSSG